MAVTWPDGWHVTVVDETGSTNADLLEAAARGAPDRSVLLTRHQTAGRGRLDRRWEAPPGTNLLVSLLFRDLPEHVHQLTQRVALAARAACEEVAGVVPLLKWPNDLLVDGRKLAGILAQVATDHHHPVAAPAYVVVGLGLNVGWAPEGAVCLADVTPPGARPPVPEELLRSVLGHLDRLPADVSEEYRHALGTLGQRVRAELPGHDEPVEGAAVDVDPDGSLVVLDRCGITHRIGAGDVIHLHPT